MGLDPLQVGGKLTATLNFCFSEVGIICKYSDPIVQLKTVYEFWYEYNKKIVLMVGHKNKLILLLQSLWVQIL